MPGTSFAVEYEIECMYELMSTHVKFTRSILHEHNERELRWGCHFEHLGVFTFECVLIFFVSLESFQSVLKYLFPLESTSKVIAVTHLPGDSRGTIVHNVLRTSLF